jgi:hypothetical protein
MCNSRGKLRGQRCLAADTIFGLAQDLDSNRCKPPVERCLAQTLGSVACPTLRGCLIRTFRGCHIPNSPVPHPNVAFFATLGWVLCPAGCPILSDAFFATLGWDFPTDTAVTQHHLFRSQPHALSRNRVPRAGCPILSVAFFATLGWGLSR